MAASDSSGVHSRALLWQNVTVVPEYGPDVEEAVLIREIPPEGIDDGVCLGVTGRIGEQVFDAMVHRPINSYRSLLRIS